MTDTPYVRLTPEDLPESCAIRAWTTAGPELVAELGLPPERPIVIPLAGHGKGGPAGACREALEGLTTLLALEPSHPDRTLYLDILQLRFPNFERRLERRVARAFASERHETALREAVVMVNLAPGRAETRFNLGLLLMRIAARHSEGADSRRWAALARGEFSRAAELAPELFWGHYHRGVLAYEAALPEAARADWLRFLDRFFADKAAPSTLQLPLLPLDDGEAAELPGLAYAVLLDFLGLPRKAAPQPTS